MKRRWKAELKNVNNSKNGKKENAKGNEQAPVSKGGTMAVPKGCLDSSEALTGPPRGEEFGILLFQTTPIYTFCRGKCGFLVCNLLILLHLTGFTITILG